MEQLSMYDYLKEKVVKDDGQLLAEEISKKVCDFIESNILKHCYPLKNKNVEFEIWDHVKHLGRKLSIEYSFEHNWERDEKGVYKCVSDDDAHINNLLFESELIHDLEQEYKGIECSFYIAPGLLDCSVENIDKVSKRRIIK